MSKPRLLDRKLVVAGVLLPAAFGIALTHVVDVPAWPIQRGEEAFVNNGGGDYESGRALWLVLLTSSTCSSSRTPGFADSINRLLGELPSVASGEGKRVHRVGVSVDWNVQSGLRDLSRYGTFDEIVVGNKWLNSAVIDLVWRTADGVSATPQLILLERQLDVDSAAVRISILQTELIERLVGAREIMEWIAQGTWRQSL